MPEISYREAERIFALVLDTFSMPHHPSVVDAVDGLTLVFHDLWRSLLVRQQTPGALDKILVATCPCPYCSGRGADVRADHADSIKRHRRNLHHSILADFFFTPVRIHRDFESVENMLEQLELEKRGSESDGSDQESDELARIKWDVPGHGREGCRVL